LPAAQSQEICYAGSAFPAAAWLSVSIKSRSRFVDILVGVAIFVAGGLILSPILFRLHLRDKPY